LHQTLSDNELYGEKHMSRNMLKWSVGAALLTLSLAAQAAANGVVVSVAPEKPALGKSDDVVVKVTFTNTSGSPQYVLKSHTPFGGMPMTPLFEVTRDGSPVRYLGAVAKRPAPTAADYYLLKPGASYSAKVELSSLYDMATTGDYTIRFRAAAAQLFAEPSALQSAGARLAAAAGADGNDVGKDITQLQSDAATVWIDGARPRGSREATRTLAEMQAESMAGSAAPASLSTSQCSSSQQSTISQALSAAQTMATNADAYMARGTMGTRYTKWFGAVNSSRVSTIKSHFAAIKSALASKPITVNCGCTDTSYAYVYPTQPYTIYVCKAFWNAPLTGTDSKGGTLVHETSHFNVIAGTDDWAYGQSAAASLAISNPARAIDNADSHEYFGENTPALQ
jgi:peptidyl-Lys metalloendopeptidase